MTTARSPNAWFPAFGLALAAFASSLAFLGWELGDALRADSAPSAPRANAAGADGKTGAALTYRGALPGALAAAHLLPATEGEQPDIEFLPGEPGDPVARYFVPVANLSTALTELAAPQLQAVLDGTSTFAEAGGAGARPIFYAAAGDAPAVARFTHASPALLPSHAEVIEALKAAPAAIAFLPIDVLSPSSAALGVDGTDIVRGRGDPTTWAFVERIAVRGLTPRGRAAAPALASSLTAVLPRPITVVATGDILQSRCALARIESSGDWGAALRGPVGAYLANADLALASLDGSIQDINRAYRCIATTNLSSPPPVVEALTLAGIDAVTVATNHIFDCGIEWCGDRAFLRTLALLDAAGIRHVGGGRNLEEALAPVIFEVGGVRFGVLGFDDVAAMDLEATATSAGTAPLDDDYAEERAAGEPAFFRPAEELTLARFTERIAALRALADVVIVQVQTGTEDTHDPSPRSVKALRAAADAGATLVVGNQAHWVQAVETRGGTFIAYALGNFVFDQQHTPEHEQGYLLEAAFHGPRLVAVRMVPYRIRDQHHPEFVSGPERLKILGDVFAASARLPR